MLRERSIERRYRVLRRLAVGTRAEVYQATSDDGRSVAIKRILTQAGNADDFEGRFTREAAVVAALDHPNLVEMIDVGQEDRECLLVMELLDGHALSEILAALSAHDELLPIELACAIVARLASGLAHAHQRALPDGTSLGIVHRDIEPDNVMIGRNGVPKLLDFGLATLAGLELTAPGMARGDLTRCQAPEQARGQAVDARADIFALGALLFESISGRPLYEERDERTLALLIQRGTYAPIGPRLSGCDPELVALIGETLAVDRDQRLGSASELEQRLMRLLSARKLNAGDALAALVTRLDPEIELRQNRKTRGELEGQEVILSAETPPPRHDTPPPSRPRRAESPAVAVRPSRRRRRGAAPEPQKRTVVAREVSRLKQVLDLRALMTGDLKRAALVIGVPLLLLLALISLFVMMLGRG